MVVQNHVLLILCTFLESIQLVGQVYVYIPLMLLNKFFKHWGCFIHFQAHEIPNIPPPAPPPKSCSYFQLWMDLFSGVTKFEPDSIDIIMIIQSRSHESTCTGRLVYFDQIHIYSVLVIYICVQLMLPCHVVDCTSFHHSRSNRHIDTVVCFLYLQFWQRMWESWLTKELQVWYSIISHVYQVCSYACTCIRTLCNGSTTHCQFIPIQDQPKLIQLWHLDCPSLATL